ncbi:MAG: PQQ-dependent sugar dehydrogenase [Planctomycetota bacterium]|jgi:glucose/arabinose dehydrogenase
MRRTVLAVIATVALGLAGGLWWSLRAPRAAYRPPRGLQFPVSLRTPYRRVPAFGALRLDRPVFLTGAQGTNRLFVVEQAGRIKTFENRPGTPEISDFLDLSAQVSRAGNEEGLLGLAFAPDYAASGRFYVYYSAARPRRSVLSRFGPGGREEILLEVPQPYSNHNGGMLTFGPDGMLYLGLGDGGSGGDPENHGQDRGTLLGAILRLDVSGPTGYAIPPDNPFTAGKSTRAEIWAYGLRNPWRFSFDPAGRLWAGDVGQNAWEEINLIERGGNYGWRIYEGRDRYRGWRAWGATPDTAATPPVWQYPHDPTASVTGGYVYRGASLPGLRGRYICGDYVSGDVWALTLRDGRVTGHERIAQVPSLASFGEDNDGELYAVSLQGSIYRFVPAAEAPEPPVPGRLSRTGLFRNTRRLVARPGVVEYEINAPAWMDGARARRWFALPERGTVGFAPTGAWSFPVGSIFVQHIEGSARRAPETRILIRDREGWAAHVYRWNADGMDAVLLADGANDCFTCHTEATGRVLGLRARQLDDGQVSRFADLGIFNGPVEPFDPFIDPRDPSAPLERRARTYLAVNCGNCHRPGGLTPDTMDLRYDTALDAMGIVGAAPTQDAPAAPGTLLLAPGDREHSLLWLRMGATDKLRMPPVTSKVPDQDAMALIGDWIE